MSKWTEARQATIDRAGNRCEKCGKHQDELARTLHVHHEDRNRANNALDNLKSLCHRCHKREHARYPLPGSRPPGLTGPELRAMRQKARITASHVARRLWREVRISSGALCLMEREQKGFPEGVPERYRDVVSAIAEGRRPRWMIP